MTGSPPSKRPFGLALWDSAAELAEHVRSTGEPVLNLSEPEFVEQWATATVDGVIVVLALERAGQRPKLARTNDDAPVVIGLNDGLVGIDLRQRRVAFELRFGTPFYEFIQVGPGGLIALFETGLVSVASDGAELWRSDTDLIADWTRRDDELLLTFSDGSSRPLELQTGRLAN